MDDMVGVSMRFSKKRIALIVAIVGIILIVLTILFVNFGNSKKQYDKVENIVYYNVTFDYGNNQIEKLEIKNGNRISQPKISEREGMVFLGWYLDDELYDFNKKITKNIKLIAKWQELHENQISVAFDSNGGSFVQPILLNVGEKILKPSDPKLDNYTFSGWYLNDKLFDFDVVVNENITLVAKWDKVVENNNSNVDTNNNSNNKENNNSVSGNKITPQSIYLNLSNINLYCNDVGKVTATVLPAESSDKSVKWTSSNDKVASVDGNGKITPVSVGTAIITASTVNGKKATVNVTVKEICKNESSTVKPDKVTGVYIKYTQSNSVSISYNKANNGNIYEIYRSSDNNNYTLLKNLASLSGDLGSIDTSKNYYYKVKSCTNNKVCGEFSDAVYVPAKIKAPSNIKFSGSYSVKGNSGAMKVTFDSSDADSYSIYSSNVGVASNNMIEQDSKNSTEFKLVWDTNAVQYKVVAKKSGTNYEMYSSSDVYQIPSIGKASNCNTVVTQTKRFEGGSTYYSYQYDYNWDLVSDIEGYLLKETSNSRVFKSFSSNVNSYQSTTGWQDVTLCTYKKGENYNIETYNVCSLSKNF